MSHEIGFRDYHCSVSEKRILADLNTFAFDPQESMGYHGGLTFHRDIVCKNSEEAAAMLEKLSRRSYDDHRVFYKDGRKKYWLVRYEFHC